MEIKAKGESLEVGGIKQAMVKLNWTSAIDFDLAALIEKNDGTKDFVYYANLGNMNEFPFMQLSGDAGVGDSVDDGGENEETMRIAKLDDSIAKIHIVAWDFGAVGDGSAARFKDSDVKVALIDDKGTSYDVLLDSGELGNTCIIATIDNTSPMGAKLINESKMGTLKGLTNTDQLFDIANS